MDSHEAKRNNIQTNEARFWFENNQPSSNKSFIGLEMKMKPWECYEEKPHCISTAIHLDHKMEAANQW